MKEFHVGTHGLVLRQMGSEVEVTSPLVLRSGDDPFTYGTRITDGLEALETLVMEHILADVDVEHPNYGAGLDKAVEWVAGLSPSEPKAGA